MKKLGKYGNEEIDDLKKWLPKLIYENSYIWIELDYYAERPDVREKAIHFMGNKEGFLSLREIFNYCSNEFNYAHLDISILPFVTNKLDKTFLIEFCDDDDQELELNLGSCAGITSENNDAIVWKISYTEASQIIMLIHGFIYDAWNHLHFDPESEKSKYAVMFYLIDK